MRKIFIDGINIKQSFTDSIIMNKFTGSIIWQHFHRLHYYEIFYRLHHYETFLQTELLRNISTDCIKKGKGFPWPYSHWGSGVRVPLYLGNSLLKVEPIPLLLPPYLIIMQSA